MRSNLAEKEIQKDSSGVIALSGLSHKTGGVDLREQFALKEDQYPLALQEILQGSDVSEAVVVSTCNRVEIIAATDSSAGERFTAHVEDVLEKLSGLSRGKFRENLYHLRGESAVGHVFRVASGLDSLVPGEPQILGQLKSAFALAHEHGATKTLLNHLFQRAFGVAKSVRSRTEIGKRAVSVCYAARELAQKIYADLSKQRVMLIGAGEMGTLALKHFQSAGAHQFFLANKTLSRAADLAGEVGGVALGLDAIEEFLPQADIVIGAATLERGMDALLTESMVREALQDRPGQPQLLIDLAVPRNFDSAIGQLNDAFLFNVDDLEGVVQENLETRRGALDQAELIVGEEVLKFLSWMQRRSVEPVIKQTLEDFDHLRSEEVLKALRRLDRGALSAEQQIEIEKVIEQLSQTLLAKVLHQPIRVLKAQATEDPQLLEIFREFFKR